MAKLYRTTAKSHPFCYSLQKCEDIVVAAAYLDLKMAAVDGGALVTKVLNDLDQFWIKGHGLSDRVLIQLNGVRRAKRQREIMLVDGHSSSYSLVRGEQKAELRKDILIHLQELRELAPSRYAEILEAAARAAGSLVPAHPLHFAA